MNPLYIVVNTHRLSVIQITNIPTLYLFFFFFFNDTATTEIYTLSLHDALPHLAHPRAGADGRFLHAHGERSVRVRAHRDRKSTRLNSSHSSISYACFCVKKK